MTLRVQVHALKLQGQSTRQIAAALGVCEGTVRYHVRHQGSADGRKNKPRKIAAVAPAVDQWILARYIPVDTGDFGRLYLRGLHAWLRKEHGYEGSRKSVERYVREKYPRLQHRSTVQVPTGVLGAVEGFEPSWVLRLLLGKEPLSAVRDKVGATPRPGRIGDSDRLLLERCRGSR